MASNDSDQTHTVSACEARQSPLISANASPTPCPLPRPLPQILDNGITELWSPPDSTSIVAELCFVHGLMGHPLKTWYHGKAPPPRAGPEQAKSKRFSLSRIASLQSSSKKDVSQDKSTVEQSIRQDTGCYWPLDLVPGDFDNVRILTYGYDSHPSHFFAGRTNQMNITQHAHTLLQQVTNSRIDCLNRPILFVAHSLGGILVKDALVQSTKYSNHLQSLYQSCFAAFFFGTPHRGSGAARYGEILTKIVGALPGGFSTYNEVLRGLRPNAEKLSLVEGDFNLLLDKDIPADQKIQIYSFQEGKGLSSVKLFDGKVVPDSSSFFNRKDVEQHSFVNENHMDMARLQSEKAQAYGDFRAALKGYLAKIRDRDEETAANARKDEEQQRTVERQAMFKMHDFEERCLRQHQLDSPLTNVTFEWLWTSTFEAWLKNDTHLFWISGKPASGKSTLMNYIATAPETLSILQSLGHGQWERICFFFDFRAGGGIANNMEGFLRCLLYQISKEIPDLCDLDPDLVDFVKRKSRNRNTQSSDFGIPIHMLRKALVQGIQSCGANLLILLDGLDEYEGNKAELTNFIKALRRDGVKICTASRPEPPFPDAFAGLPSFRMQDLNFAAIKASGVEVLQNFYSNRQYEQSALLSLAEDIAHKSQGVFLWARFAIDELIKGLTEGEELGSPALERRLEEVPPELKQIYSRIFQRTSQSKRNAAGLFLLLICYQAKFLTTEILGDAVNLIRPSWPRCLDSGTKLSRENDGSFTRRLLAATGGTVDIYAQGMVGMGRFELRCNVPRLIHRTVKTYLELGGWHDLIGDMFYPALGHETWLKICTQLLLKESSNLAAKLRPGAGYNHVEIHDVAPPLHAPKAGQSPQDTSYPTLLIYALESVLEHAGKYDNIRDTASLSAFKEYLTPQVEEAYRALCHSS